MTTEHSLVLVVRTFNFPIVIGCFNLNGMQTNMICTNGYTYCWLKKKSRFQRLRIYGGRPPKICRCCRKRKSRLYLHGFTGTSCTGVGMKSEELLLVCGDWKDECDD